MHTILFGESGNGKSWLYKHVLAKNNIAYVVANGGNASRLKSLTKEIYNAIINSGSVIKVGYTEDKKAKISALVAEAEVNHQDQYQLIQDEPLLFAFKHFENVYPNQKHIIVIDNLEFVFTQPSLLSELADILVLLDDARYSQYNVTFLIVGLPLDILDYFSKIKNMESVANRLVELPKVQGLLKDQVDTLVEIGFNSLLKFGISKPHIDLISNEIYKNTMGIAQKVHEFCEILAYAIQDKMSFRSDYEILITSPFGEALRCPS